MRWLFLPASHLGDYDYAAVERLPCSWSCCVMSAMNVASTLAETSTWFEYHFGSEQEVIQSAGSLTRSLKHRLRRILDSPSLAVTLALTVSVLLPQIQIQPLPCSRPSSSFQLALPTPSPSPSLVPQSGAAAATR